MKNNKVYKIVIPILCLALLCVQIVCYFLNIPIEINAIVDVVAVVVSLIFVLFLKEEKGISETKDEIKEDIEEGLVKIEEIIDSVIDKKSEKEWQKVTLFLCD